MFSTSDFHSYMSSAHVGGVWWHRARDVVGQGGSDADKRTGLMSMAYGDFAAFMADVDKAFSTWDKVINRMRKG